MKQTSIYAAVLLLAAAIQGVSHASDALRPNIVLILCDDLGYADVGFNGATDIPTPELDQLARNGTVFSSAYVAHPFCGPSRAGLMTGRYPHFFGSQFNLPERGEGIGVEEGIPLDEPFISSTLQRSGYYTGMVGKWHLGKMPPYHPNQRGFDDFYGFLGGGHCYFPHVYAPEYDKRVKAGNKDIWSYYAPLEHNGKKVTESEYLTDALSQEGVRFVRQAAEKSKPFFLYLSYNAPHTPLQAKPADLAKLGSIADKDRRTYAAMVHAVDRGVGEVVEALKSTDVYDNTLIVFLSDNGGRTDAGANNQPLRGRKGDTYEGGFRVPMLFHWPKHVPPGETFPFPVSALDLFPTFAGLSGATIPVEKDLDGKDIWDALISGQNPRPGEPLFALRHRLGDVDYADNEIGVRRDEWKLHRARNRTWQLFNVNTDISESQDLSEEHPDVVEAMVADVKSWTSRHVPPRWFDSEKVHDAWHQNGMPGFEKRLRLNLRSSEKKK